MKSSRKTLLHQTLEGTWGVCHSLWDSIKIPETKWVYKGSLELVSLVEFDLIVARLQIENTEPLGTGECCECVILGSA